jgi:hypothetical protein
MCFDHREAIWECQSRGLDRINKMNRIAAKSLTLFLIHSVNPVNPVEFTASKSLPGLVAVGFSPLILDCCRSYATGEIPVFVRYQSS